MQLAPTELKMWEKAPTISPASTSDDDINAKYEKKEKRILTEINREKLPNFAAALKKSGYMETRPFYQRRSRWDSTMQSKLIESFLINIPVPPIILYEKDYNMYEVMDGQQRITAIQDFYDNNLVLTGLELWQELNGRTYKQLPHKIKAGIDRRSISSIVLITESTSDPEEALFLKQLAFERLNTGGIALSNQEIRNCLYYGKFNELLLDLSKHPIFVKAWDIPIDRSDELAKNNLYKKMEDVELVLRFFALRHFENFRNGIEEFLNAYMMKSLKFTDEDINSLKNTFIETIELAHQIYEDKLFKPFDSKDTRKKGAYKDYYDAVMVGFSHHLDNSETLIMKKYLVLEQTKKIIQEDKSRLFTGGSRTKADLQNRIRLFSQMLAKVIAG
jgi:Protein of unknown function DUF262